MFQLKRLVSDSAIYGLGGMTNRLATLALLPVFTAYLTPAELGVVALLTAFGAFLSPVFSLGFGTSIGVCYFNTTDAGARRQIVWSASWILFATAMLLGAVGWLLRGPIGSAVLGQTGFELHTSIALGTVGLNIAVLPSQLKLQFEQRPLASVLTAGAGLTTTIVASVWMVAGLELGSLGVLVAGMLGQFVGTASTVAAAGSPALAGTGRWAGRLLRHGLPMVPSFFLVFLLLNGVRWPLEWEHGLQAVGVYSVGATLGSALSVFTTAFISAWTPFALGHADDHAQATQVLGKVTFYYVAFFGFLSALFFLFATPIVMLFAEHSYRGAADAVGLTAAAHFFSSLFLMLLPPLYFARRVDNVVLTQLGATLFAVTLAHVLIPRFAVLGAALTVAVSFLSLVVIQWIALRLLPVLRIRYDYWRIGTVLAVCGATAVVSFRIDFTAPVSGIAVAAAVASAAATLLVIGPLRGQQITRLWAVVR